MAGKSTFTNEEWITLLKAPGMAGLVVVAADPGGPFGTLKESWATGKALAEIKFQGSSSELIRTLVDDMASAEGRASSRPTELLGMTTEQAKAHALDICKQASAIVESKSPQEATEFKQWLLSLSQRVAEAAKEGGFLGFGGTLVSEHESAAINELARTLGLSV